MINRKLVFFLIQGLFLHSAFSQELHPLYTSTRYLGMGGAGIATADDETALLENPAGLGKVRDFYGTILDPELDGSSNLSTFNSGKSISNPFDLGQVEATTAANPDRYYHARGTLFPSMVIRNFGIGVYDNYIMDAQMNTAGTSMQTFYRHDLAIVGGLNMRLFDGIIKIGGNAKLISRTEIDKALDPTAPSDIGSNASSGMGMSYDGGLMIALPVVWIPTLAVVAHDIGGTSFHNNGVEYTNATSRPNEVSADYDVALAVFPIHGVDSRSSFTVEEQQVIAASKDSEAWKYYHIGYEWNYADRLFLRAGMNQRYWTAGFEFATPHTQIQLATYGEEVGQEGNPVEDRRVDIKLSLRF